MTTRGFSILIFLGAVISWVNFLAVLFYVDPYASGILGQLLFYITIIIALVGTLYLLGRLFRRRFIKYQTTFQHLKGAWRQAIWFTTLMIGSLFLYQKDLFNWLNMVLLFVILIVLEFFFVSYKKEI